MTPEEELELAELEAGKTEVTKPKAKAPALKTFVDPAQLKKDLSFSDVDLSNGFMNQAPFFASYAHMAHQAGFQADRFKQAAEIMEARIDKEIRKRVAEEGGKITEAAIAKEIKLDERYQKALNRANEAKMIAGLAKESAEAFKQRRDMLIQMGADAREELKGSLRMKGSDELADKADRVRSKRASR